DVTGHGAAPAMVTAAVASAFRASSEPDLAARLARVYEEAVRSCAGKYHVTMSALELDPESGRFVVYGAGGLPVMSLPPGARRTQSHGCRGADLGFHAFQLGRTGGALVPRVRLLIMTDGIPEAKLPNARLLGMRTLARIFTETAGADLEGAVRS